LLAQVVQEQTLQLLAQMAIHPFMEWCLLAVAVVLQILTTVGQRAAQLLQQTTPTQQLLTQERQQQRLMLTLTTHQAEMRLAFRRVAVLEALEQQEL
jgi:hypothetical protein